MLTIKKININIEPFSYDIKIGEQLNFDVLLNAYQNHKLFIVTDRNLYKIYQDYIEEVLFNYDIRWVVVKVGEKSKSFKVYQKMINALLAEKIQKQDLLIAFGGGVIGDLTGFVAGTLFRGMNYINIPTSLLAMADSSIGGKTGIDTSFGKNLVGVFKQPLAVYIDIFFLETLPQIEFENGMAEIVKASLIKDQELFDLLLKDPIDLREILLKAIMVKKEIVEADPYEKNERMLLNFGHTFAHAIEQVHRYKIKHGLAVSMGMELALLFGVSKGWTNKDILEPFYKVLSKYNLPLFSGDVYKYIKQIDYDKKVVDDYINFIIVTNIGKSEIKQINKEALYEITYP